MSHENTDTPTADITADITATEAAVDASEELTAEEMDQVAGGVARRGNFSIGSVSTLMARGFSITQAHTPVKLMGGAGFLDTSKLDPKNIIP